MSIATFDQAVHVLNLLKQKRVSRERLTALVESGLLADLLEADPSKISRADFQEVIGFDIPSEFEIVVNYGLALREAIVAADCYDEWRTAAVMRENFQANYSGVLTLKPQLIYPSRSISSEEMIAEFNNKGLLPATIEELLAFAAAYPRVQKEFAVVALGSRSDNGLYPVISKYYYGSPSRLGRGIFVNSGWWSDSCRFLGIPKEQRNG